MNMNVRISNDSLTAELIQIWIDVGNTALLWFDIIAWIAIIAAILLVSKFALNVYNKFSGNANADFSSVLAALLKKVSPNKKK